MLLLVRTLPLLVLLLTLVACSSTPATTELPREVHGGWKLQSKVESPSTDAPGFVKSLGLQRFWKLTYDGPTTVRIEAYEMKAPASAFEAVQLWRRDGKRSPLNKHSYFFLVGQDQPNANSLADFVTAFNRAF